MFKFPLERLLTLKVLREREIAGEVGAARRDAHDARCIHVRLVAIHAEATRDLGAAIAGAPTAGEAMSLTYSVAQLRLRLGAAGEETDSAERMVHEAQHRLTDAMQQRQVLARLRERRREVHRIAESARDRTAMDGIALTRFNATRVDLLDSKDKA